MNINEYVGNQIRIFRKKEGLKREDIADELNVSISAYGRMETGHSMIDSARIFKLCQYFKQPLRSFFPPLLNLKEEKSLNTITMEFQKLLEQKESTIQFLKDEITFLRQQISTMR
tara:strand:+ start:738 stop:1082 length:345 start_codon:yes stop_codon:yes gene_type:complete